MIYAKEASEITKKNSNNNDHKTVIKKVLPAISTQITVAAQHGCNEAVITAKDINRIVGFVMMTKQEQMNVIKEEVESYGYEVWITPSYSSIHFKW